MGFYINETIKTELHWKDVSVICEAIRYYKEQLEQDADDEYLIRMGKVAAKLNRELYNNRENNKPNGH